MFFWSFIEHFRKQNCFVLNNISNLRCIHYLYVPDCCPCLRLRCCHFYNISTIIHFRLLQMSFIVVGNLGIWIHLSRELFGLFGLLFSFGCYFSNVSTGVGSDLFQVYLFETDNLCFGIFEMEIDNLNYFRYYSHLRCYFLNVSSVITSNHLQT